MLSPTAYQLCGFVNLSFLNLSFPLVYNGGDNSTYSLGCCEDEIH